MSVRELFADNGCELRARSLTLQGDLNVGGFVNFENMNLTGTTPATSTSTGSLTVDGGIGVGNNIRIAQSLSLGNDTVNKISTDGTFADASDLSLATQKATKSYIDSLFSLGISWQNPVDNLFDASVALPENPQDGDRSICAVAGNGWLVNNIYTYNVDTEEWDETPVLEGFTTYVLATDVMLTYNGSAWVNMGFSISHLNLTNIGTNSHSQIDSHISNSTTAHFNQDLKTTGSPQFVSLTLTGGLAATTAISTDASVTAQTYLQAGTYVTAQSLYGIDGHIYGTDDSASKTSGSLICDGGVGIAKKLFTGDSIDIASITSPTNHTSLTTDNSGNFSITATGATINTAATNVVNVLSIQDATNVASGALKVEGGASVKKGIHAGYQFVLHNSQDTSKTITHEIDTSGNATLTANGSYIKVANTANTSSTSTGGLVVDGGVGIVKNLYVGGGVSSVSGTGNVGINFQQSGSRRWDVIKDGFTETGSNAGSNFEIVRCNDSGAYIDAPLLIDRIVGSVQINTNIVNAGLTRSISETSKTCSIVPSDALFFASCTSFISDYNNGSVNVDGKIVSTWGSNGSPTLNSNGSISVNRTNTMLWKLATGADPGAVGCIRFRITPTWTSQPDNDLFLFAMYDDVNGGGGTNWFRFKLGGTGGGLIMESACPTYNVQQWPNYTGWQSGVEVSFEFVFNFTTGVHSIYINNVNVGSQTTTIVTGSRSAGQNLMFADNDYSTMYFAIRDVCISPASSQTSINTSKLNSTGLYLQNVGGLPSPLNHYEEYSHTTAINLTNSPTTFKFVRCGKNITMSWEPITGQLTSGSSWVTNTTAIPARFCPAIEVGGNYTDIEDGTVYAGVLIVQTTGGVFFYRSDGYPLRVDFNTGVGIILRAGSISYISS